jgi:hypothetical protein
MLGRFKQVIPKHTTHFPYEWKYGRELYANKGTAELDQWLVYDRYHDRSEVTNDSGNLKFNIKANTADEWAYLYLDQRKHDWADYSWEFEIVRHTRFREFAFNFRYVDFDNRYRYRFEDDEIYFDKKIKGRWFNNTASIPFPVEMGRSYLVEIRAIGPNFQCLVDGELKMSNCDTDFPRGPISVILWEDDGATDCIAEVKTTRVRELIGP